MIAIVDYGMGNLHSVYHKLHSQNAGVCIANAPDMLDGVSGVVLPGVGHFQAGMHGLRESGMAEAIKICAEAGVPVLGICLGCQLLCEYSEEGDTEGLSLIKGEVVLFPPELKNDLKVPHMGWNTLDVVDDTSLLKGVSESDFFYFVHSYHLQNVEEGATIGTSHYGVPFPAVIRSNNVMGTQFHPEKSHDAGIVILNNFIEMCQCFDLE